MALALHAPLAYCARSRCAGGKTGGRPPQHRPPVAHCIEGEGEGEGEGMCGVCDLCVCVFKYLESLLLM
jgi:hypothetical protein